MMTDSYLSIFLTFLRFGCLAWGGPVAQIGMIRDELVDQKAWITSEKFRRVLALYQALPGPEAHELCVYFGMIRKGRLGGLCAGLGFMLPGLVLMLLLAWAYKTLGPAILLPLFVGVTPAVAALIVRAAHRICAHVLYSRSLLFAALVSFILSFLGVHFLGVFAICAIWQILFSLGKRRQAVFVLIVLSGLAIWLALILVPENGIAGMPVAGSLLGQGLKAGLLSFGGAYTVIPFLQDSMVGVYEGVTPQAFLDGIALSNVIPAPLVIFGTYLGFLADGFAGALWVTFGIFLPAFSFTLIGHHQLEKLVENPAQHGLLDGVSAAVAGLLVLTALEITLQAVNGPMQGILFICVLISLYVWGWRWSIPVLILLSGFIGYFAPALG